MRILCSRLPFPTSLCSFVPLYRNVGGVGAPHGGIKGPRHVCRGCWSSTRTGSFGQQASQTRKQVHIFQKPLYISQVLQQRPEIRLREGNQRAGLQVQLDERRVRAWENYTVPAADCFPMLMHIFPKNTHNSNLLQTRLL